MFPIIHVGWFKWFKLEVPLCFKSQNVCHMKTYESLWEVAPLWMESDEAGLGRSAPDRLSLGLFNLSSVSCLLGFYLRIVYVFCLFL